MYAPGVIPQLAAIEVVLVQVLELATPARTLLVPRSAFGLRVQTDSLCISPHRPHMKCAGRAGLYALFWSPAWCLSLLKCLRASPAAQRPTMSGRLGHTRHWYETSPVFGSRAMSNPSSTARASPASAWLWHFDSPCLRARLVKHLPSKTTPWLEHPGAMHLYL
jgi:hypothetical protein